MTNDLVVVAEVHIPLDRIAEAVGSRLPRPLLTSGKLRVKARPEPQALKLAIERVVSALNRLEIATNTPGEGPAREALMSAVHGLRKAHVKNRNN